jgi:hypothetical protein
MASRRIPKFMLRDFPSSEEEEYTIAIDAEFK